MTRPDPYADWDAAYVLGALSAADRADFEEHLPECPACRRNVTELAGLPGLLAKVPAADVAGLEPPAEGWPEPPASLMPALPVQPARPATRRRRWVVPAAAAAALLVGGIGGYAIATGDGSATPPPGVSTSGPVRLAFDDVVPSSMTAVVDVSETTGGTRLRVECQYSEEGDEHYPGGRDTAEPTPDPSSESPGGSTAYALWVVEGSGTSRELARWTAVPGERRDPTVTTDLSPWQISAIEIRLVDGGQTLLRADVPGTSPARTANASSWRRGVTADA